MTVSELIRTKRAVRQFTDASLSEEAVRTILNAGRQAQSSKNTQPWHFIALRDRATLRNDHSWTSSDRKHFYEEDEP